MQQTVVSWFFRLARPVVIVASKKKKSLPSVRVELTTSRLWDSRANQLRQLGLISSSWMLESYTNCACVAVGCQKSITCTHTHTQLLVNYELGSHWTRGDWLSWYSTNVAYANTVCVIATAFGSRRRIFMNFERELISLLDWTTEKIDTNRRQPPRRQPISHETWSASTCLCVCVWASLCVFVRANKSIDWSQQRRRRRKNWLPPSDWWTKKV